MSASFAAASFGSKLLVLGVIASFLIGGGVAIGLKWQAGEVSDAEAAQHDAERDRDGWRDVASKWEDAIKAQNTENAKAREAADKQKRAMDQATERANQAAEKFIARRAELEEQAERDRANCTAERIRVCGAPLR
jgi:preprotein translocase subunit SecF